MEEEGIAAKSPFQRARESIEKKFAEASKRAAERAKERALKKLAPAPRWKPFGTPAKRRLHGKDW